MRDFTPEERHMLLSNAEQLHICGAPPRYGDDGEVRVCVVVGGEEICLFSGYISEDARLSVRPPDTGEQSSA